MAVTLCTSGCTLSWYIIFIILYTHCLWGAHGISSITQQIIPYIPLRFVGGDALPLELTEDTSLAESHPGPVRDQVGIVVPHCVGGCGWCNNSIQ